MKRIGELLEENQVGLMELCARLDGPVQDLAAMEHPEQIRLMEDIIRSLPAERFRGMLGLSAVRFLDRALRKAGGRSCVVRSENLYRNPLLSCAVQNLMTLGMAQALEEKDAFRVSAEVFTRLGPVEREEEEVLDSSDSTVEMVLGLCELCGCVPAQRVVDMVTRGSMQDRIQDMITGLVNLCIQRIGLKAVIRVNLKDGQTLTLIKHPELDLMSIGHQDYFLRTPADWSIEDASFRALTGFAAGNPWYGPLLEAMYPSGGKFEMLFSSCHAMSPDSWEERLEAYAETYIQEDAVLVLSMLRELTENVAWMIPVNPGSDLFGYIECLPSQDGRDMKRAGQCVSMLEQTLPRWSLMGYSMEDEQVRIRQELLKKRTGYQTAYRALCPCGSGRIYGKCHGRVQ